MLLAILVVTTGNAQAQDASPPKDGVITPKTNVDPAMKVAPPRAPTRTPVVRPPTTDRTGKHPVLVVPK